MDKFRMISASFKTMLIGSLIQLYYFTLFDNFLKFLSYSLERECSLYCKLKTYFDSRTKLYGDFGNDVIN